MQQQSRACQRKTSTRNKDCRSGPWWLTTLERQKCIQDVPLHLIGEMLNLWEDKWVTETETNSKMTTNFTKWFQSMEINTLNKVHWSHHPVDSIGRSWDEWRSVLKKH
jgi:hypothetical protein